MSYVDAYHDLKRDIIHITERVNGKRVLREYRPEYVFYIDSPQGSYRNMHGKPVEKITCRGRADFKRTVGRYSHVQKYESDIPVINKALEKHYAGQEPPRLHTAFFDIEVAFQKYKYDEGHKVRVRKKK